MFSLNRLDTKHKKLVLHFKHTLRCIIKMYTYQILKRIKACLCLTYNIPGHVTITENRKKFWSCSMYIRACASSKNQQRLIDCKLKEDGR